LLTRIWKLRWPGSEHIDHVCTCVSVGGSVLFGFSIAVPSSAVHSSYRANIVVGLDFFSCAERVGNGVMTVSALSCVLL
jgi:hypothetical protein